MKKIIILLSENSDFLNKKRLENFLKPSDLGIVDYSYPEINGVLPRAEVEIINRIDYIISQFKIKNINILLATHSEIVFNYLRVLVAEGVIDDIDVEINIYYDHVCLDAEGDFQKLELNLYGQIDPFPYKIFGMGMQLTGRILRAWASAGKNTAICGLNVNENGQILTVSRKDNPNDFGLPGGKPKLEIKETKHQTLIREIKEETGLDATIGPLLFGAYDNNNYFVMTYLIGVAGEIHTNEAGAVAWVDKETLLKGSFANYNSKLLSKYEKLFPGILK